MAIKNDSLGDRMKRYESVPKNFLMRRTPAIIRLDGKAFHTFTRGMEKPFDNILMNAMQLTMKHLCENVQGCVLGYTQSDEITLVLTDYATITTDAWFGYNVQKMTSIAASIATLSFNDLFFRIITNTDGVSGEKFFKYKNKVNTALFDARAFSVPKDEVANCLIWRQQDATRNSIEAVGQANFSQKQLHGKSCNEIQDMLFTEKGINWNDFPTDCKRGACCIKKPIIVFRDDEPVMVGDEPLTRGKWVIDHEIPIFTQNRAYIEDLL